MRVAIIGSGISGLAAAWRLHRSAQVWLFEAAPTFGGHTRTVDVTLPDHRGRPLTHPVDTGFLVFNHRTYPGLTALLAQLQVPTAPASMSFSVRVPATAGHPALEWGGASLATVFADKRNLLRPRFWAMLADIARFNRLGTALALGDHDAAPWDEPLGAFLRRHRFSTALRDWYLLPMLGSIWSCPTERMLDFPVGMLMRFCHNHGLLQINDRPTWYTVAGGARQYVQRIVARLPHAHARTPVRRIVRDDFGVTVHTDTGAARFDAVVLATHTDQALALLASPSPQERAVLGAIRYQRNHAVLHTDTSVMPRRRAVWSAWNYEHTPHAAGRGHVCLHYWLNALQPLPFAQPVIESLNPQGPIDPRRVLDTFTFEHPVLDHAAVAAQRQLPHLQGHARTWYAGAWAGHGFHEDGLQAGYAAADACLAALGRLRAAA